jgi:hypothetical protein
VGRDDKQWSDEKRDDMSKVMTTYKYTKDEAAWSEPMGIMTRVGFDAHDHYTQPDDHGYGPHLHLMARKPTGDVTATDDERASEIAEAEADWDEACVSVAFAPNGFIYVRTEGLPPSVTIGPITDIHHTLKLARK